MRYAVVIEKVDGNALLIKTREGNEVSVTTPDNVRVMGFVKASIEDIKPNSYIGVTADPQPDGSQKAVAIHIFGEAQRGTGEGHRPWDLRPGSTMTNAAVETTVAGVDGQVLTVKYKSGDKTDEKKVIADAVSYLLSALGLRAIGGRAPLHLTSVGKLFLAHEDPQRVRIYATRTGLTGHTRNSITDVARRLSPEV